jgi:hypothetical protein
LFQLLFLYNKIVNFIKYTVPHGKNAVLILPKVQNLDVITECPDDKFILAAEDSNVVTLVVQVLVLPCLEK